MWLLPGGMHGCSRGCVWLLLGGACVVAPGGAGGACMVAPGGAYVVALGGHAWLLGGRHAWLLPGGHAWLLGGGMHGFFDEIRSMSGRYASYWNAFLFARSFMHNLHFNLVVFLNCAVVLVFQRK